jgi:nitrate reductase NapE component
MLLANAIHHFTYHIHVLNILPLVFVVVFGFIAWMFFLVAMGEPAALFGTLIFGVAALILGLTLTWHHTELRHGVEMKVQINEQQVWIPAKRLPSGQYWPTGFARRHR